MICKKCGANIGDASKFCGYCGEQVNNANEIQTPVQNIEQPVLESVQPENQTSIEQVNTNSSDNNLPKSSKNRNNKIIFMVLGIVLAVIAAVLVVLAFNKTANSSIATLEKALDKFSDLESGTINTKLEMLSTTGDSMNLSATAKFTESNDNYDIALTVNKSILTDEINLYSRVNEKEVKLFAQSKIVDMLGYTGSDTNIWLNYAINLSDLEDYDIDEDEEKDIDLKDILDNEHFKYIDTQNNLKHYELLIDKSLMDKIETKARKEGLDESLDDIENTIDLTESIVLNLYIDKNDNLVKISIDLTKYIEEENVSSVLLSIEFSNLNNTTVIIPNEALNSNTDLEKYISEYKLDTSFDDPNLDYDVDYDSDDLDINMDTNL